MRNKDVYIITCSKCGKENRYEDYSCVGLDQRERIIDDSIMSYTCPHCGENFFKASLDLYRSCTSLYCTVWTG